MPNQNPVESVYDRIQKGLRSRFENYGAWLAWFDSLFAPEAFCNINDQKLTLSKTKRIIGKFIDVFDTKLGTLGSMLVQDDWCSIRYVVYITNKETGERTEQKTMEFFRLKDNPQPIGTRIIEEWVFSITPLPSADEEFIHRLMEG